MIEADNVHVTFKKGLFKKRIRALDGFNVHIKKGEVFGLLGPNGAGKSTAMYCFLGLIRPEKGTVSIFGEKPAPGSRLFERISYVPEEPHYHLYLTVEESLRYYGSLYRANIPDSKIHEAIERVGLQDFKDLKLEKCSKGMKQKVGVATCLLNDAELIFLDEPTRGLDPIIVKEFRDILIEKNKSGCTIVMNSHILSEVEMVCNSVAIIDKGKVIVQDELKNLMKFDFENYFVHFDSIDPLPDFLIVKERTQTTIKGEVPLSGMKEFLRFVDEKNLKVYECSLKRASLEETFFNILKGRS